MTPMQLANLRGGFGPGANLNNIGSETNRNKRRDKKAQKKRSGMRVDESARKLAELKLRKLSIPTNPTVRFQYP